MAKIDFQPMPKRFMVWDTLHREWVVPYNYEDRNVPYIYDMYELMCRLSLTKIGVKSGQYIICQSTNLFDKDGEEIFEGNIVENHFTNKFGLVYYDEDVAGWRILYEDGTWDDLYYVRADIAVVGHILSNSELLEKK